MTPDELKIEIRKMFLSGGQIAFRANANLDKPRDQMPVERKLKVPLFIANQPRELVKFEEALASVLKGLGIEVKEGTITYNSRTREMKVHFNYQEFTEEQY